MIRFRIAGSGLLAALLLLAPLASAQTQQERDADRARDDEIAELRRQLDVVLGELDRVKTLMAVPEEAELKSSYGLGPAASKIYGARPGLSLGGYMEAVYRNRSFDSDNTSRDTADALRTVLYVGYKFTDKLIFNTEIEFEHAGTGGGGSVSVEFATLDYLMRPELNFRGGLLLVPMGFVNEVHEPPFYYGTQRPEPERFIIPSTWRENGGGVFGEVGETLSYRAYVVNGLEASGFSSSGLRGGRQKGSRAHAEDLAGVFRVDWDPTPGLRLGGSYYYGNSGQEERLDPGGLNVKLPDVPTQIWELHSDYYRGPLHLRGLWTQAYLGDARELNDAFLLDGRTDWVAEQMIGGYAELGYDLMQWLRPGAEQELIPFFRFEYLDPQHDMPSGFGRDRSKPRRLLIPGINWKPHPQIVLKLDYRYIDSWDGDAGDEISIGMGLVF